MRRNKIIILVSVLCLILLIFIFLPKNVNSKNLTNYPPKNQKILAFGDSLIQGVGATPDNDLVSAIEKNLEVDILNYGKNGDTTKAALNRINDALLEDPGVVIILLGGNDVLQRVPQEETFSNLEKIVQSFQQKGAVIVLLGVRGGVLSDSFETSYEALAKKYRTGYVSNVLKNIITNPKYMSDAVHPNDSGYKLIAERVTKTLQKIIKQ